MNLNRKAVFAVFDFADNSSASCAERLLALGIASRAEAKPLAMEWASKHEKYKAKITKGQRGLMLPRNSAAERAMYRVLDVCFPAADKPKTKKASANKQDAVEKLFKAWSALSGAEKRRFARMQIER
ncbi:hypothetical protein EBT31_23365 [bacterium]|nr:hypothetical protein [bacterium]